MKTSLTLILFLLFTIKNTFSQSVDFYGKEVAKDICSQYGMRDDKEAKACLDKICDAADIPDNFVLAPCTNIDNCFALYKNGYSYIVYDINFFNKIKTYGFTEKNLPKNNIDWAALTILAHEIGHHMCLHTTNPNLASLYTPVQIELQADEYAGTIMYKLGATLIQAQLAMNSSEIPDEATLTHPARKDRLAAIAKGYNKHARNQYIGDNPPVPETVDDGMQDMALVEGGAFYMGNTDGQSDEKPMHKVTLSSFYMDKYAVTVAEFKKFFDATGYSTTADIEDSSYILVDDKWITKQGVNWRCGADGATLKSFEMGTPVTHVSYDDAISYCKWMSNKTGKQYRLPTEAEWEYTALGGKKFKGYTYAGSNNIDDVGWYNLNSGLRPHKVGQKLANELGIYDLTGNVWQWCNDVYGQYSRADVINPVGEPKGLDHVLRGGSCLSQAYYCRPTLRLHSIPTDHGSSIGFRVVISK